VASATDWIDGYLARAWDQRTRLGAMLDPIADKAMVASALLVLMVMSSLAPLLLIPAAVILFREVFVSGLREYLGPSGATLSVTRLAKYKTTVQMVAISALLAQGWVEHRLGMATFGMDGATIAAILDGEAPDVVGLTGLVRAMTWTGYGGLVLLWAAAALTLVTGADYLRKAWTHLKETA
jgi:cardiolipin synthase